jgi:hypothetical protein
MPIDSMTDHLTRTLDGVDVLSMSVREARRILGRPHVLAGERSNAKLAKARGKGWQTWGLSLAPARSAGLPVTVCPQATPGCMRFCVAGSGKAITFANVSQSRQRLTKALYDHPIAFCRILVDDVIQAAAKAKASGDGCAIRLNVFSDVEWERALPVLFEIAEPLGVAFYDYTKVLSREVPPSYRLTLSHSEVNRLGLFKHVGGIDGPMESIAIPVDVKRGRPLPSTWHGVRAIDGDKDDRRFLDPPGAVVLLRSKVTRHGRGTSSTGRGFILQIVGQEGAR